MLKAGASLALGWMLVAGNVAALDNIWTNPAGSYWETAANWSAGAPSNNFSVLYITNATTKIVDMYSILPVSTLTISNLVISCPNGVNTLQVGVSGSVTEGPFDILNGLTINSGGALKLGTSLTIATMRVDSVGNRNVTLDGGSATIAGGGVFIATNVMMWVGESVAGSRLTITNGGKVFNDLSYLGWNSSSSNNTVLVTGSGSVWSNRSYLYVGWWASGNQLIIANSGTVYNATGVLGRNSSASSNNTVLVTGSGSVWSNTGNLVVGYEGAGNQLTITNGGTVFDATGYLGFNSSASSNNTVLVTGSGSVWTNSGGLTVGLNGYGNQLTIANSGAVYSAVGYLGYYSSGSNNTVLVTASGSVWSNTSSLYVGYDGAGNQLTITNGGKVFNGIGYLGYSSFASNNTVLVTGAGSVWQNRNDLWLGGHLSGGAFVSGGTNNQVTVADNAWILVGGVAADGLPGLAGAGGIAIGDNSGSTPTLAVGNGARLNAGVGYLGLSADETGAALVTGPGSIWSNSSSLIVGYYGAGNQLTITNGGKVFNGLGVLGFYSFSSNNTVLVTGTGSAWRNSGDLYVGLNGEANQLTIANSGTVYNAYGFLGFSSWSTNNTVLVTGTGSVWSNTSSLYVGYDGAGNQLIITNGGTVYNATGYLGYNISSSSNNTVLVTGTGSVWSNTGNLFVGRSGAGNQLTIANTGTVYGAYGYIGYNAGASSNAVTVTGAGSAWRLSGSLHISDDNNTGNSLTITNGGQMANTAGYIGSYSALSQGNWVLVTGPGSLWANSGDLTVGEIGYGNQLTLADGGQVLNGSGYLGWNGSASNNTVLVTGAGSTWRNSSDLYVGYNGAANQLTITDSGAVLVGGKAIIGTSGQPGNQLTVSGGSLAVTNDGATGTLDVRRGTLTLDSGAVTVDNFMATNGANSVVAFNGGALHTGGTTVSNGVAFVVGDGMQSATLDLLGGAHNFADGLTIASNAMLTGTGMLADPVTLASGSTLSPGHSPGQFTFSNSLTLAENSTFLVEMNGYIAGSSYDQLVVSGGLTNNNAMLTVLLLAGFTPTNGAEFVIVDSQSAGSGTFRDAPEGSTNSFGSSWPFAITYAGGISNHAVVITSIPEPSSLLLVALGTSLLAAGIGKRRKKIS